MNKENNLYLLYLLYTNLLSFSNPEALKALAVVYRTNILMNGIEPLSEFQISDMNGSLVLPFIEAIEETKDEVLFYEGNLIDAKWSHANGGYVRSLDLPYITEKEDDFDTLGFCVEGGAGLSIYGARKRADAGHNYRQILEFYYPGAQLKKMSESVVEDEKITAAEESISSYTDSNDRAPSKIKIKIIANALNCRAEPNSTSKVIKIVRQDEVYHMTEQQDEWAKIDNLGWINLKYAIQIEEGE